jgi:hypothetical protein
MDAVAANPELSDVAIAKRVGVDEATVRRARSKSTSKPTSANADVEKRTGSDGRVRRLKRKAKGSHNSSPRDMVDALALIGQLLDIMQPPTRKPPKTRVTYWDRAYRPANENDYGQGGWSWMTL